MTIYIFTIVSILTISFTAASILGFIALRLKLSPIVGYLIAGYLVGPNSAGFIADLSISEQLAEIGVILMLFGVGLHFSLNDLLSVKSIAIPGAVGQFGLTALITTFIIYALGWSMGNGLMIGLSIGVASTVVLVRALSDFKLLDTLIGQISVGWLIVEDLLTIFLLVLVPIVGEFVNQGDFSLYQSLTTIGWVVLKLFIFIVLLFTLGKRLTAFLLNRVARHGTHELFTIAILAVTFVIATTSSLFSGTSIALGAFIAGVLIGQTEMRHKAAANVESLRDAFVVIFFLAIGMLFNPSAIVENFKYFIAILLIILLLKPAMAFIIARLYRYPIKTSLAIAIALAQIGEFSFILAEQARQLKLLSNTSFDIIVASSIVSIAVNPLLFKLFYKPKTQIN